MVVRTAPSKSCALSAAAIPVFVGFRTRIASEKAAFRTLRPRKHAESYFFLRTRTHAWLLLHWQPWSRPLAILRWDWLRQLFFSVIRKGQSRRDKDSTGGTNFFCGPPNPIWGFLLQVAARPYWFAVNCFGLCRLGMATIAFWRWTFACKAIE